VPAATAPAPAAPASEARQLVAKARALYQPWDLASREDFALAEQLLERAVALEPADGDAWGAYALLSCGWLVSQNDTMPVQQRRAALPTQVSRAVALAPLAELTRFVRAFNLRFAPETAGEALRLMREEATRQPANRLLLRTLGLTLRGLGQGEQAFVYFDKAIALPGPDPITQYVRAVSLESLGRINEAEAALDEAIAMAPHYVRPHRMKITLLLDHRGDLPAARAHLAKTPATFVNDEAGGIVAAMVWLYSGDGLRCLRALNNVSDIPEGSTGIAGFAPKAFISGWAQRVEGNVDAARSEWRQGLQVVERRLAAQPNSGRFLLWKIILLAHVNEQAAAEALLPELRQRARTGSVARHSFATCLVALGRLEEAFVELGAPETGPPNLVLNASRRSELKYHPVWAPLRKQPRFETMLRTYLVKP
jgi:Flp pilus assembly protein TadD